MVEFQTYVRHQGKWVHFRNIRATGHYGAACVIFAYSPDYGTVRVRYADHPNRDMWEYTRHARGNESWPTSCAARIVQDGP